MSNLNVVELYPKILVYKNLFEDIDLVFNYLKETESKTEDTIMGPWHDWYTFGKQSKYQMNNELSEETDSLKKEKYLIESVNKVFLEATNHYIKHHNLNIDFNERINIGEYQHRWRKMGPSFAKYFSNAGSNIEANRAMEHHTDFEITKMKKPDYKFCITVTTYLNDNYDGGEIEFYIDDKLIPYKPEKGDVIVFPSGNPNFLSQEKELYYHAVKLVQNGEKYFVRQYWQRYEDVPEEWSNEWNKRVSQYGEEETIVMYRNEYMADPETTILYKEKIPNALRIN
jgi:hypothetical protein